MVAGILVPIAVVGTLVMLVAIFLQRGRDGFDLSPRNLLRLYLYLGSLAGLLVLVIGLSSALTFGFASVFGSEFSYGAQPEARFLHGECPPGAPCPSAEELNERQRQERERRKQDDLLRGITFTVLGLVFWGLHAYGRRTLGGDERSSLRRAYLLLATAVFGLGTIVLLPMGIYQALSFAVFQPAAGVFRPGGGEALSAGIVLLPLWLFYLRTIMREFLRPETPDVAASAELP